MQIVPKKNIKKSKKVVDKPRNPWYNSIRNKERDTNKKGEKNMTNDMKVNKMVGMIVEAYIKVMGEEKWNSLTAEQQHEVIMTITRDLYNRI